MSLGDPPFAHGSGRGVTVAIVDSGIHLKHPHISAAVTGFGVLANGRRTTDFEDRLGHGTAVAAAIMEKAPEAEYRAVKVFATRLSTTSAHLVQAVQACATEAVRLINLSLTATDANARALWEDVVGAAADAGAIVVSAGDPNRNDLFPGCLEGAVGVAVDPICGRDEIRYGTEAAPVIGASPYPRPIPGVSPERNLAGVSFAVANVTGFLARLLEIRPDLRTARDVLDVIRDGTVSS